MNSAAQSASTYRAICPALQRAVVAWLDSLDRDILVAVQRRNNNSPVRKCLAVSRVRREQALKESSGRVEYRWALSADFDTYVDLRQVDEVRGNPANVRRVFGVQVRVAKEGTQLVRLGLARIRQLYIQQAIRVTRCTSPRGVASVGPGLYVTGSW